MLPKLEPFILPFTYNFKKYRLRVEQILLTDRIEQFKIGSERSHIIIETNRPFFRNKKLMHRKPDVKCLTDGKRFGTSYDELVRAVLKYADEH